MNEIVIIHTGGIGDLVMSLPTFAAVRAKWPLARITLVGLPERAEIARMAGYVGAILDFETCGISALFGRKKLGNSLPSALVEADLILMFIPALLESLKQATSAKVVAVDPRVPAGWSRSASEFFLGQVRGRLDLPKISPRPCINVPDAARRRAKAVLAEMQIRPGQFVAIHPGSGSERKNWHLERFAEIARRLARTEVAVLWLLGPAEAERGLKIPADVGQAILECPDLPLAAGILASAGLFLGNDSGISHLAAATGTPAVLLFGPSDARIWQPIGENVQVIATPADCAPCEDDVRRRCPRKDCMEAISTERVWKAVAGVLSRVAEEDGRAKGKS